MSLDGSDYRPLTAREKSVLYLRCFGLRNEGAATVLGVSPITVKRRLWTVAQLPLPGLEYLPGGDTLGRRMYIQGLLDAGAPNTEIKHYLKRLLQRAQAEQLAVEAAAARNPAAGRRNGW